MTNLHSPSGGLHPGGGKSGFAASRGESLRPSDTNFLLGRGSVWPSSSNALRRLPKPLLLALILITGTGCSQSSTNRPATESATTQPSISQAPRTAFERDLQFIRNGKFTYVWVFSRQDGKPIDKDDAAYLRSNAPQVVDWASEDGKHVVAGTNFDLEQGNMPLLRKRFVVEDYTGK